MTTHQVVCVPQLFVVAIFALSLLSPPTADADTIFLKDGTEIEGTVVEESDEYVKIEIQLTDRVRDTKFVKRADIRDIKKIEPDELDYLELKKIVPTGDFMSVSEYDELIKLQPQRFLDQYPSSARRPEVEEILKTLEEEKARVVAGGVKLKGKWITAEEIKEDPYNHKASVLVAKIEAKLAAKDYVKALRHFDKLESGFGESKGFAASVPAALSAVDNYEKQLKRLVVKNQQDSAQRESDLKKMGPNERNRTEAAIKQQLAAFTKRWTAASEAGEKWLPISDWDANSLTEALKVVESEKTRLAAIDVEALRTSSVSFALALKAFNTGEHAAAEIHLKTAEQAGARSEIVDDLAKKVKAAKEAHEAAVKAEREKPPTIPVSPPDSTGETTTPPESPGTKSETPTPPVEVAKEETKPDPDKETNPTGDLNLRLEDSAGDGESAKKKGPSIGIILGILAGVMVVVTVLAKMFTGGSGKEGSLEDEILEEEEA